MPSIPCPVCAKGLADHDPECPERLTPAWEIESAVVGGVAELAEWLARRNLVVEPGRLPG